MADTYKLADTYNVADTYNERREAIKEIMRILLRVRIWKEPHVRKENIVYIQEENIV